MTSVACKATMSSENIKSACNFSLNVATVGVPAIGSRGALPKARQTSRCYKMSSAQVSKYMLPPSEYTETRFDCCTDK